MMWNHCGYLCIVFIPYESEKIAHKSMDIKNNVYNTLWISYCPPNCEPSVQGCGIGLARSGQGRPLAYR